MPTSRAENFQPENQTHEAEDESRQISRSPLSPQKHFITNIHLNYRRDDFKRFRAPHTGDVFVSLSACVKAGIHRQT
jgi:hypothetical protein